MRVDISYSDDWNLSEKQENPLTTRTLCELADSNSWKIFCSIIAGLNRGQWAIFVATDVDVKILAIGNGMVLIKNVRSRTFAGL